MTPSAASGPDPVIAPGPEALRRETIRFFALAYGATWVFWVPVAVVEPARVIGLSMVFIGAFGPTVAAFYWSDRAGRRDLIRRFVEVRRISPVWWVVILLYHPLVALAADWLGIRLGGPPVALDRATLLDPTSLLAWLGIMVVGGPLAEEFGWRGYALDRLQRFGGAVNAGIALGILWALWHLPLFFIRGTSQNAIGFGTPGYWIWTTQVVAQSVVLTWVYNNTDRSIFAAFLFHFMSNSVFSALAGVGGRLPPAFELANALVSLVAATVVVVVWRARSTRPHR